MLLAILSLTIGLIEPAYSFQKQRAVTAQRWPDEGTLRRCMVDLTRMKDGKFKDKCLKLSERMP